MKKIYWLILFILLRIVLLQAAGTKLAVLELRCAGLPDYFPPILTEKLRKEIAKTGEFALISKDQMIDILGDENYNQTALVKTDKKAWEACAALKAERLLYGDIGKLGSTFFLNLKLLDCKNETVIMQISKEIKGSEDDLIALTVAAAQELKDQPQSNLQPPENAKTIDNFRIDSLKNELSSLQSQLKSEETLMFEKQRKLDNLQYDKEKLQAEKAWLEKLISKEQPQAAPPKIEPPQIEEVKPDKPVKKREELKD